ncbi:hypothetical protein EMIHUDRAFT_208952 [Emiliania huxleyi CCMP1516]|uniref:25S rRNA (uridine-N(3))-methyltransferase BMT5-like domain-containing protein n=2 Tax=Emiliania huxleyi TaxID=2903 RepID=A0A0D3J7E4_EMIH1|nr:hypothetical protein EMIHUDRAFT_208952 [Emiliania huxleyi CCMP1516]EOD19429.1 hypothetical protein EMIHUDRAFT_208952 [Emiliania huxleyi CCMP1516]|eukprot:XP_005771858.1 hypothetical protein EMIHUDRAFT_208952 [Emiliania huxleyi CCMP1516]
MRILTVGDGDLSYSLALQRAFGADVSLVATTLPAADELCATYRNTGKILAELAERGATVLHGIDATRLPLTLGRFAHVVFCHPHLGLSDLIDEAAHAQRHSVLVAHFLDSAAALLEASGTIHLTLCGSQPRTWAVDEHAARLGLDIVQRAPPATPSCFWPPPSCGGSGETTPPPTALAPEPGWAAPRKFRSGSLGSRHWLGRFGYEHRRCEGDADMHVENSVELLFCVAAAQRPPAEERGRCPVCGWAVAAGEAEEEHVRSLASPVLTPAERAWSDPASGRSFRTEFALESRHEVPAEGEGARAFAWSRKAAFARELPSKKVALTAFREGRLLLNGAAVEETRCLRTGDAELAVVWKPAGCKSLGDSADVTAECPVHVMVVSATAETSPVQLTTLRLVSGGRRGRLCGDLCFFLRAHAGCPVVGDRYARRERGELPRYCNALRKSRARPQISCIGVGVGGGGVEGEVRVELAVPPRLLASTWSTPEAARGARGECGLRGVSDPF